MTRQLIFPALILVSAIALGCGQGGDISQTASTQSVGKQTQPSDPAARVAFDFLTAVQKGDEARISACLTPLAAEQLKQRDERFPVSGMNAITLQFGEVRKPTEDQALVQCMLTDTTQGNSAQREEICCLLRLVDNQWRVSGLAIGNAQGQPQILNFEAPPLEAMGPPTPSPAEEPATLPVGRPSPPRTANESFAPDAIR